MESVELSLVIISQPQRTNIHVERNDIGHLMTIFNQNPADARFKSGRSKVFHLGG